MISAAIWVERQQALCVLLKAPVKLRTVQKKLCKKINTAPIPNKRLFEMKCLANILAFDNNPQRERNGERGSQK